MPNNRISEAFTRDEGSTIPDELLKIKLELPKAVLEQMKDTHLCNTLVEEALSDIEDILERMGKTLGEGKG